MVNGGLISVRHRQVHLRAHGKEACVDRGIAGVLASLWAVCDTRSCCEDEGGRAYVVPTAETRDAAVQLLTGLRLNPELVDGTVYFRNSDSIRLDDLEQVRRTLQRQSEVMEVWRVNALGVFERHRLADESDV